MQARAFTSSLPLTGSTDEVGEESHDTSVGKERGLVVCFYGRETTSVAIYLIDIMIIKTCQARAVTAETATSSDLFLRLSFHGVSHHHFLSDLGEL